MSVICHDNSMMRGTEPDGPLGSDLKCSSACFSSGLAFHPTSPVCLFPSPGSFTKHQNCTLTLMVMFQDNCSHQSRRARKKGFVQSHCKSFTHVSQWATGHRFTMSHVKGKRGRGVDGGPRSLECWC